MKKTYCPTCHQKSMKAIRCFNDDRSTWKTSGTGKNRGYRKIKRPSAYTVILRCSRPSCKGLVLRGRSRAVVHASINNARKAATK